MSLDRGEEAFWIAMLFSGGRQRGCLRLLVFCCPPPGAQMDSRIMTVVLEADKLYRQSFCFMTVEDIM
jgi:hypothetical protein